VVECRGLQSYSTDSILLIVLLFVCVRVCVLRVCACVRVRACAGVWVCCVCACVRVCACAGVWLCACGVQMHVCNNNFIFSMLELSTVNTVEQIIANIGFNLDLESSNSCK